jgi:hypothetical protein
MEQIEHLLETLRVFPHVAALAFTYGLALPIGWDRERNERSAGLRTFPLVAVSFKRRRAASGHRRLEHSAPLPDLEDRIEAQNGRRLDLTRGDAE